MTAANKKFQQLKRKIHTINSWKQSQEQEDIVNKQPVNFDESTCKSCGFKARYKFIRCPECNEVQE